MPKKTTLNAADQETLRLAGVLIQETLRPLLIAHVAGQVFHTLAGPEGISNEIAVQRVVADEALAVARYIVDQTLAE